MEKDKVMAVMNCSIDDNFNLSNLDEATNFLQETSIITGIGADYTDANWSDGTGGSSLSCWHYYQDYYYPQIIRESYPVYLQERSKDKGKQAFEIIKTLKDKKLIQLRTVGDFIDLMDELIKIL